MIKMSVNSYAEGKTIFASIHGEKFVEEAISHLQAVSPELADLSISWIFGDIYTRPQLSLKTRELINIAALVAQGMLPQVENHVRTALKVGCTLSEIKEVILQMIIIVGFPKVVNVMMHLKSVFDECKMTESAL